MYPNDLFTSVPFQQDLGRSAQGNVTSAIRVGYAYLTGASGRKSVHTARWYFTAAAASEPSAVAWLAYIDARNASASEAFQNAGRERLSRCADAGDPVAQTLLGRICELGQTSLPPDSAKAKALYMAAAPQFLLAKTLLGRLCHREGNKDEGLAWTRQAADEGETSAMNALADVLLAMRSQSATTEAKRLLRLAVKKQNVRAKYLMGVVYYREGFTKNTQQLKRAFQLFDAAAATGYPPALAAAGLCLLNGIGTNRDERAGQDRLNAASQFVPLVSAQLRTTKGRV